MRKTPRTVVASTALLLFIAFLAIGSPCLARISVTDEMGRHVSLPTRPKRLVVLTGYPAEVICALEAGDRIVGVCNPEKEFLPEIRRKPSVGQSAVNPNLEKLLELDPDLVIAYQWTQKDVIGQLEAMQIPVICCRVWTLKELQAFIEQMAILLDRHDQAKIFWGFIKDEIDLIEEKTRSLPTSSKPEIFMEVFNPYQSTPAGHTAMQTPWGIFMYQSPMQIQMELAGGINCVGEQPTNAPRISPEWVVQKNPNIIIKIPQSGASGADISADHLKQFRDELIQRAELKQLQPVRQDRVFVIHPRLCAGPRQVVGICYYAKWFHPALFPNLDPERLHAEMLKRFWGLELHGSWAYPESNQDSESQAANRKTIKIVDGVGRHVEVPIPLRRIVAGNGTYGPEMLCCLGVADRIVGVADHAKLGTLHLAPFLKGVPGVGRTTALNAEKIIELTPEVVLLYETFYPYPEAFMNALTLAGIKMMVMDFHRPEFFDARIRLMGRLLDKQERAESLIAFEKRHLDLIRQRVADVPVKRWPSVYLESYRPFQSVTPNHPDHALLKACGGINIFSDLVFPASSNAMVGTETIIERDPDIIIKHISTDIVPGSGYAARDTRALENVRASVMGRPGWGKISAVKTGKVYVIDTGAKATHPSVYCAYLARWLHTEIFKDLDPTAVYKQWMETFLGIPFKGVYAHPDKPVESTSTREKGV